LSVLDKSIIGKSRNFLCGDAPTLADYFSAPIFSLTELIHSDTSAYANIGRWYGNVKRLKSWPQVNEVFNGFAASLQDKSFVGV
jgi:glutathione S-transferase